jgi:hypothetical protein
MQAAPGFWLLNIVSLSIAVIRSEVNRWKLVG